MFVFVTKRFLVRSFFFSLPNMIRRAEKPDLYATRATLEYLQLIILTMTTVYRPWYDGLPKSFYDSNELIEVIL